MDCVEKISATRLACLPSCHGLYADIANTSFPVVNNQGIISSCSIYFFAPLPFGDTKQFIIFGAPPVQQHFSFQENHTTPHSLNSYYYSTDPSNLIFCRQWSLSDYTKTIKAVFGGTFWLVGSRRDQDFKPPHATTFDCEMHCFWLNSL